MALLTVPREGAALSGLFALGRLDFHSLRANHIQNSMSKSSGKRKLCASDGAKSGSGATKAPRVAESSVSIGTGDKTSVSNVRVAFLRPNYHDLRDWTLDPKNLYIGRAGIVFVHGQRFPPLPSIWANPFKAGRDGNRASVLKKFETYIRDRIASDPQRYNLDTLRGRNLGCWCVSRTIEEGEAAEEVCHGQVLKRLMAEAESEQANK